MDTEIKEEKTIAFGLKKKGMENLLAYVSVTLSVNHLLLPLVKHLVPILEPLFGILDYLLMAGVCIFTIFLLFSGTERNERTSKIKNYFTIDQSLLCVFSALFVISVAVNSLTDGMSVVQNNSGYVFDVLICLWVMYPTGKKIAREGVPEWVERLISVLLYILTLAMVFIVACVFMGKTLYTFNHGMIGINGWGVGAGAEYHLQLNAHHNTTGAYSAMIMLICIGFGIRKKGLGRIMMFVSSFVHSLILILTNSRSTFISAGIFLGVLSAIMIFYRIREIGKRKYAVRWIVALVTAVIVFFLWCMMRKAVFGLFEAATDSSMIVEGMNPEDAARDLDVTNWMGRDVIWMGALKGMFSSLKNILVGVTPYNVCNLIEVNTNGVFCVYTHNQFLEIGVATGIVSLLVFIIWLVMLAKSCFSIGLGSEDIFKIKEKIVPLMILFLMIFNMAEATLLYYNYFVGGVLAITAGWCIERSRLKKINIK